MNIYLKHDFENDARYFVIDTQTIYICSSDFMIKKFNMTKEEFIKVLTTKVVRHNNLIIYEDEDDKSSFDITFKSNSVSDEVYLKRFKETFAPQLTLLALGDENQWWFI